MIHQRGDLAVCRLTRGGAAMTKGFGPSPRTIAILRISREEIFGPGMHVAPVPDLTAPRGTPSRVVSALRPPSGLRAPDRVVLASGANRWPAEHSGSETSRSGRGAA